MSVFCQYLNLFSVLAPLVHKNNIIGGLFEHFKFLFEMCSLVLFK